MYCSVSSCCVLCGSVFTLLIQTLARIQSRKPHLPSQIYKVLVYSTKYHRPKQVPNAIFGHSSPSLPSPPHSTPPGDPASTPFQSLAQALAPKNISVGVVAPGFVETDMAREVLDGPRGDAIRADSPFGRVAQPEEVAEAVVFMATRKFKFGSGAIIDINGASYLRS